MTVCSDKAIILLGHGSRVPGAGDGMTQVADRLRSRNIYGMVETCSMSGIGPHFPEVFTQCVCRGARTVVVIPYFLHIGMHLLADIPEMLQTAVHDFPEVTLILGHNLGFDDVLVDLVSKRIDESEALEDVRCIPLRSRREIVSSEMEDGGDDHGCGGHHRH